MLPPVPMNSALGIIASSVLSFGVTAKGLREGSAGESASVRNSSTDIGILSAEGGAAPPLEGQSDTGENGV